jgi:hypothetical protein
VREQDLIVSFSRRCVHTRRVSDSAHERNLHT